MTARSRGGLRAFRLRMSAPRRSPFSRMRCRSMRPSETRGPSRSPAKNAEKARDEHEGERVERRLRIHASASFRWRSRSLQGKPVEPAERPARGVREAAVPGASRRAGERAAGTRGRRTRRRRRRRCAGGRGGAARLTAVLPKRRRQAPRPIARTSARATAADRRGVLEHERDAARQDAFHGQTSWQTSQPNTCAPSAALHGVRASRPRCSIVQ